MDGVELEFKDEAILAIAKKAMELNTGARGLRSIVENGMMDIMYSVPGDDNIEKVIVTEATILKNEEPIIVKKSA